ncbi:hypothetical protein GQR58_006258 [Nymphon striatum]|nr:hypothetical protein GQR58_006258 [Nymphon striatum]
MADAEPDVITCMYSTQDIFKVKENLNLKFGRKSLMVEKFVVVEFPAETEKSAAVIHCSWLNGIFKCYYPSSTLDIIDKVKKEELPDRENWPLYKIQIKAAEESYEKAESHLIKKEIIHFSSDNEQTPESENLPEHYLEDLITSNDISVNTNKLRKKHLCDDSENNDSELINASDICETSLQPNSVTLTPLRWKPSSNSIQDEPKTRCNNEANLEPLNSFQTEVLTRMKVLEDNQKEVLNILKNMVGPPTRFEDIDDLLPEPIDTKEQLVELSHLLNDSNFKNLMINYLALLGGTDIGNSIRRILQKLGTNRLWSLYSLKGKRGKESLMDLRSVFQVIFRACTRNHASTKLSEVELHVAEALKHAPKKKGGTHYKLFIQYNYNILTYHDDIVILADGLFARLNILENVVYVKGLFVMKKCIALHFSLTAPQTSLSHSIGVELNDRMNGLTIQARCLEQPDTVSYQDLKAKLNKRIRKNYQIRHPQYAQFLRKLGELLKHEFSKTQPRTLMGLLSGHVEYYDWSLTEIYINIVWYTKVHSLQAIHGSAVI